MRLWLWLLVIIIVILIIILILRNVVNKSIPQSITDNSLQITPLGSTNVVTSSTYRINIPNNTLYKNIAVLTSNSKLPNQYFDFEETKIGSNLFIIKDTASGYYLTVPVSPSNVSPSNVLFFDSDKDLAASFKINRLSNGYQFQYSKEDGVYLFTTLEGDTPQLPGTNTSITRGNPPLPFIPLTLYTSPTTFLLTL